MSPKLTVRVLCDLGLTKIIETVCAHHNMHPARQALGSNEGKNITSKSLVRRLQNTQNVAQLE